MSELNERLHTPGRWLISANRPLPCLSPLWTDPSLQTAASFSPNGPDQEYGQTVSLSELQCSMGSSQGSWLRLRVKGREPRVTFLVLSFPVCKMGVMIVPHLGLWGLDELVYVKLWAYSKHSINAGHYLLLIWPFLGLPGSLVVKTLSFQCRGWGFHAWLGNKDPTCLGAWPKEKHKIK